MSNLYLEYLKKAEGVLTDKIILYCDANCNRINPIQQSYFIEFIFSLFNYAEFSFDKSFVQQQIINTFFSVDPKPINFYSIKEFVLLIYTGDSSND